MTPFHSIEGLETLTVVKKTSIYIAEDRQIRQHAEFTESTKKKFVQAMQ